MTASAHSVLVIGLEGQVRLRGYRGCDREVVETIPSPRAAVALTVDLLNAAISADHQAAFEHALELEPEGEQRVAERVESASHGC